MTLNKKQQGSALEIAVEGRLDTMTAPELEAELKKSLDNAESLVLLKSWNTFLPPGCGCFCPPIRS